ncbi:uncharacterized protein LOC143648595 [Tamandua tetradactyla]|uniref:uncharacterized protein LOC143648595 n=1 Tax=Tamandua tetradactyla TaxID=48850 RepID=UPI004053B836
MRSADRGRMEATYGTQRGARRRLQDSIKEPRKSLIRGMCVQPTEEDSSHIGKTSAEEAGKTVVRELVHNFPMDLCCSLKYRINFYDASLGTLGRKKEHQRQGFHTHCDSYIIIQSSSRNMATGHSSTFSGSSLQPVHDILNIKMIST